MTSICRFIFGTQGKAARAFFRFLLSFVFLSMGMDAQAAGHWHLEKVVAQTARTLDPSYDQKAHIYNNVVTGDRGAVLSRLLRGDGTEPEQRVLWKWNDPPSDIAQSGTVTLTLSAEVLAQGKNTVADLSAWVAGGEETRNTGGSPFHDNKGQEGSVSIGGPRSLVVSNHLPDGPGTTGKVTIILHVHQGFDNLDPTYFYVYQWVAADTPTTASLTGTWTCNDHGTYQIRQQGNQVTWTGTSADSGRTFVNDFVGTVQGNLIVGHFKDRTTGIAHSQGELQIRIVGPNRLEMVKATGGFSGRLWTR